MRLPSAVNSSSSKLKTASQEPTVSGLKMDESAVTGISLPVGWTHSCRSNTPNSSIKIPLASAENALDHMEAGISTGSAFSKFSTAKAYEMDVRMYEISWMSSGGS